MVPSLVMMQHRSGLAARELSFQNLPTLRLLRIGIARVKATKERIELKLRGLISEKAAIEVEIQVASSRTLLRELREVDDQITKCNIELTNEVEMKLTEDEKIAHANAWRTHRETTESVKVSRGKVYSMLMGQCTQVLVDKMEQDVDWVTISESFDPILLFKLIEKYVLKQSDNQYPTAVLIAEHQSILSFRQEDHMGNATYYDRFTTRVEVAGQAGVCYYTPDLLKDKMKLWMLLPRRVIWLSRNTWPICS